VALTVCCIATLGMSTPTLALADTTYPLNIPAQDLGSALKALGAAANEQVLFSDDVVAGLRSTEVKGEYTTNAAIAILLKGSGLKADRTPSGVLLIRSLKTSVPSKEDGTKGTKPIADASYASGGWLAQAGSQTPETPEPGTDKDKKEKKDKEQLQEVVPTKHEAIPEILVIGSRSLDMDIKRSPDDAQPYVVFDRDTIEKSESRNIEDFLRSRLTSVSSPVTAAQSFAGGSSSLIDLRGLGPQQTLILVDGHRIASPNSSGATGQPDLNGIPLAAVERIEVLPSTASGIYGGGATGGVVNVVLRPRLLRGGSKGHV